MHFLSDKPHNPIVNSGGIMSIALILKEVQQELGVDIAAKCTALSMYSDGKKAIFDKELLMHPHE